MIPLKGRQYPQETKALSTLNLKIVLSNIINCSLKGEQHERLLSRYTSEDVFASYEETMKEVIKWNVSQALLPGKVESAEKLDTIQRTLGVIGAKLFDIKQHVSNFGQHMTKFGKEEEIFEEFGLASTGLPSGTQRISGPSAPVNFERISLIPGPYHPAAKQFGRLMAEWDRAAFSTNLLSHKDEAAGYNVKDRVSGTQLVTVQRAKMPHAQLIAYVMLFPTMYTNFMWPLWTECLTLLARTSGYWEDRLRLHELYNKRRASLPQNQISSLISSLNGNVSVESMFGTKPLLFDATGTLPNYQRLLDIGIELDTAMRQPLSATWGEWDKSGMTSPYQLITQYESLGELIEEVNRVVAATGWTTKSSGVHSLLMTGGDFIWADGTHYSENPYTALFGLKPVVSPNNATALIDDRRQDDRWNVGPLAVGDDKVAGQGNDGTKYTLMFSVMFVTGRQSITGDGSEVERYFIPGNAYLGEADSDRIRFSSSLEDPMTRIAFEYYAKRHKLYISEMYIEPELTTDPGVYKTSWDTWSLGSDGDHAFNRLVAALPPQNVRPVSEVIMYRGKWFNHRFVVQMSRPSTIMHYSGLGEFKYLEKQDGHVQMIGGELSLSHSTTVLNELVLYGNSPASDKLLAEATAVALPK